MGATMPRERHQGRVALAGGDRTMWARGYHAGTVGPGESVTGPSRQCRCRDGPLWGVTEAPGYAGGSLPRAHLELGAGF